MALPKSLPLGLAALLAGAPAIAQSRLGDLLDAGAKRLSAEAFRQEIVQRPVQGSLDGMIVEIVYTAGGTLEGAGSAGRFGAAEWGVEVRGTWSFGRDDAVCAAIVLDGPTIRANFPTRCQFWFRFGDRYFVTGSDSDRRAPVVARTVKE